MPVPSAQTQHEDLQTILFTEEQIAKKVRDLASQISRDYADRDLILIGVLKGGVILLSDLSRRISIPHEYDLVGARSYKDGTQPTSEVSITKDLDLPIRNRDVLLIEDIYDTGRTLAAVRGMLDLYQPRSLEICALLRKSKPRENPMDIKYVGFDIDDIFVVGYGLDYKERYRSLPFIGILNPEVYT